MAGSFSGFPKATLTFLRDVAASNTTAWFDANRDRYQDGLVVPSKAFVEAMAPGLHAIDPRVRVEPRVNGSIYRLNRDTRFSSDKRPYKEELAFRFPVGDPKAGASGFHMRIRPDVVGFATGVWAFPPEMMGSFRAAVAEERSGKPLAKMIAGLKVNGCQFMGDAYKRVPHPWAQDHPRGDLLKMKGLIVGLDAKPPRELHTAQFVAWCLARFRKLAPVHRWLSAVSAAA